MERADGVPSALIPTLDDLPYHPPPSPIRVTIGGGLWRFAREKPPAYAAQQASLPNPSGPPALPPA